jgi:TorA maturation chaperone TorD
MQLDGEVSTSNKIGGEKPQESRGPDSRSILEKQRKVNLAREGLYSFLARSFKYEVDTEFLTMVAAVQPVLEQLASAEHGAELRKATELLATVSSKAAVLEGPQRKKMLLDLAVEYTNLFLNPSEQAGRERVYPWESAYFTEPPRIYGTPYHEGVEAFRMVGFEKPKGYTEAEDHIALELEFMAHLTRLTIASIDNGKMDFASGYVKLQKEFLTDHLLRWVGTFSKRLMKNSEKRETNFYYALGMMLERFITLDHQTLDYIAAELTSVSGEQEETQALQEPNEMGSAAARVEKS